MSTIYADNSPVQTLVEKKKRQWAREREELAGLHYQNSQWGNKESPQIYDKQYMKSRHVTKHQKENELLRRDSNATPPRRPSLPPLYKNQSFTYTSNEKLDKEMGGETSGYGSDNPNQTPEHFPQTNHWNNNANGPQLLGGYESSSSGREDRLKWGDRGVHVGKFWEPKEVDNFGKNNNDTPGWVKRGLERDAELVVSNTSPAESPEQDYVERPGTSSTTTTQTNRCYIRGQNVPVEATELAERERRRHIALAHQEAIRQQLEEREKGRREEKARKVQEEYEEEMRIARENELERRRKEHEHRLREEKMERERKRKEALREAIEIAEKEARDEKKKHKMRQDLNITENVIEVEKIKPIKLLPPKQDSISEDESTEGVDDNQHNNNEKRDNNKKVNSPRNNFVVNSNYENEANNIINQINNNNNNNPTFISQENLALVLQNPLESFQNAQFAVLIPALNNSATNTLPIAVPLPLYSDRSAVSTARTENRILTPTQYRNKRLCDSSTQTDYIEFKELDNREKYIREKLANLEICYEHRCRKERRSRSELRESVEDRPKWGVNRPPTRYLKQSEKDPLYQRRKLRQKLRQNKTYGDKSPHSSDDSQTASPRTYRKRGYTEKRQSRALWRKNEQLFAENVRVYQTEIVPLESDKDHIYFKAKSSHQCCCKCRKDREYTDKVKLIDILKIEHNTPRECHQYKCEINDKNKLPACNNSSSIDDPGDMLEKLNSIHHGLMLKQEHWDDTPRHSMHYSPSRNP